MGWAPGHVWSRLYVSLLCDSLSSVLLHVDAFFLRLAFLIITSWLSAASVAICLCSSPVRGRKGRKGKRMRESKSKKTVLLTIESCSSLWSYWVASTHVPTPRPIPVLREMLCSMGWSQDFWPSLVKSMWLSWWPKPRACKTLPCRPNPASHLFNCGLGNKDAFYLFKWLYKNFSKTFDFAPWPTKSKIFTIWSCKKKFANS